MKRKPSSAKKMIRLRKFKAWINIGFL
jgi:hypothetical protein